jgi:hypothetical protein
MEWTFLFSFATVGLQKNGDGEYEEDGFAFLRTLCNRAGCETDPGNRRQLRGVEPDGIGEDRVRIIGLETAKRIVKGQRVPGVFGEARGERSAGITG